MSEPIFRPADILLPRPGTDLQRWSVIACDQFTAQPEYWQGVADFVGEAPSTLRLIQPEAFLGKEDADSRVPAIHAAMAEVRSSGLLRELKDAFVYVQRELSGPPGNVRRGLLGAVDLERYDYRPGSTSPIRATEGTVEERLPPRVKLRLGAPLELPHILLFLDDGENRLFSALDAGVRGGEPLYDFELMEDGGRVRGYAVQGGLAAEAAAVLAALAEPARLRERYALRENQAPVVYAVGDGNHSLATAKRCWETIKAGLRPAERETHPARFCLVELVNLHDPAISFKPIHRVLFDVDPADYLAAARAFWSRQGGDGAGVHTVTLLAGGESQTQTVRGLTIGSVIAAAEDFCTGYVREKGGRLDYVHGDGTARRLSGESGCGGMLLPAMDKGELFPSVIRSGPFPRKSFSIGHGRDKRYYLECRALG